MVTAAAYAATSADGPLEKTTVERRELGPLDILIDIKFAGICHSDIHTARNEWGGAKYPIVPGHEIAGVVAAVGSDVTKHKVGDRVASAASSTRAGSATPAPPVKSSTAARV
ncbi:hypothetical protein EN35_12235 [Rhodococcus qingshengii]|nr:hypothetical protein EN35_12235 [Rhodococcus qingshengii]